jgi:hypothetical protein
MLRNYLKGINGDKINTILAGTGFNLKKMLNRIKEQVLCVFFQILFAKNFYSLKINNLKK